VGGALHSYCQPHSIGLALGLEIADPYLIVFLHASLRILAIRPTAKLDQHLGTPQRLVTHGPSPRAWGSQLLTCNFARRYLLVTTLPGSAASLVPHLPTPIVEQVEARRS